MGPVFRPLAWVLSAWVLSGCDVPRDAEETLQRIRDGEIRAGIVTNEPWTTFGAGTTGEAGGIEVRLLEEFAREQGARIRWREDAEHDLFDALERGELDVVIGGLTDETPFSDHAGLTQPFAVAGGKQHVWAVRPGESALLLEIDRFLQTRRAEIQKQVDAELPP